MTVEVEDVRLALREVIDPEVGVNIVDLGLVRDVRVDGEAVLITMILTTPACPLRDYLSDLVESSVVARVPGIGSVTVEIADDPLWSEEMMSDAARRQLE